MAPIEHKLAAILSADAVGYSRLMAEDEAATIQTLSAYREQIAVLVREHRGRVVDAPGDNILAEFPAAIEAVRCAMEIQGVLRARNVSLPAERRMDFRIGVHMGDVATEGGRIYGDGVNIAARLEALAEAGGVCISATVHEQVRNKLDAGFTDLGDQTVKNIPDPVRVYRVQPRNESEAPKPAASGPQRGAWIGGSAAVGVVLLALGLWWTNRGDAPPGQVTTEDTQVEDPLLALPSGPTVAVLPFTNLSGDPEQEYFSDGLSEDIITKLSRFKDLFVIARNSTFQHKGKAVDVRNVARELGARYVLEGSIRKAGTSLRVTAQLLDASDGTHLWAETFDRDLSASSLFAVQDEITERVVSAIGGTGVISRARFEEVEGRPTDDLAAYECVLLAQAPGRDYWIRNDRQGVRSCLERAVRDDPGYADAWAQLTYLTLNQYAYGNAFGPDPLGDSLRTAQRAVESGPSNPNALSALAEAHFFRHELDRFFVEADRAIALNPNDANTLLFLGGRFIFSGEGERGIALVRRAAELDPQYPSWLYYSTAAYHFQRKEYSEALAAARKIGVPGEWWSKLYAAASYGQLDRQDDARTDVEELLAAYPGFTLRAASEELRKFNFPDEVTQRYLTGLRKAGVPEESSEQDPPT